MSEKISYNELMDSLVAITNIATNTLKNINEKEENDRDYIKLIKANKDIYDQIYLSLLDSTSIQYEIKSRLKEKIKELRLKSGDSLIQSIYDEVVNTEDKSLLLDDSRKYEYNIKGEDCFIKYKEIFISYDYLCIKYEFIPKCNNKNSEIKIDKMNGMSLNYIEDAIESIME